MHASPEYALWKLQAENDQSRKTSQNINAANKLARELREAYAALSARQLYAPAYVA